MLVLVTRVTCQELISVARSGHPYITNLDFFVLRRINSAAFNNDKSFQNVLNTAFEHFINLSARAPEYISLFMDDQLRKVLQYVFL